MVSVVPAGLTRLFQHPVLDWNLFSTKQQPLTDREVRADVVTMTCNKADTPSRPEETTH